MSDLFIEALHLVPALCSAAAAVYAFRAKQVATETHILINSRMEEYLKLTRSSSHAEGVKDEKDRVTQSEQTGAGESGTLAP
jgi:RAB protein geranylgeranyltransferase component A